MNTKYSNWKMWYYVLCMVLTLQLAACSEETHDEYTAAPEIEDTYIDQLDALIAEMTDLQQNSDYGDKKGQYPTESRAILTDAIDDANRAVLLIKYQQPSPSESEKQRYVAEAKASIEQFKSTIRTEDAETTPAELFVDGRGDGGSYIDFGRSEEYVNFGTEGNQAFTVEFWVKVTKGGGKDQNVFLSTYMGGDGWRNGWMMYWRNADGGISRASWGETGGNSRTVFIYIRLRVNHHSLTSLRPLTHCLPFLIIRPQVRSLTSFRIFQSNPKYCRISCTCNIIIQASRKQEVSHLEMSIIIQDITLFTVLFVSRS